jgi:hypothetical protein
MKDTKPRGPEFRPQFYAGALARTANTNAAAHGAEMDAPCLLPAGSHENASGHSPYPAPRATPIAR